MESKAILLDSPKKRILAPVKGKVIPIRKDSEDRYDFFIGMLRKLKSAFGFGPRMVGGIDMKRFFDPRTTVTKQQYLKKLRYLNGKGPIRDTHQFLIKKGHSDKKIRDAWIKKYYPEIKRRNLFQLKTAYQEGKRIRKNSVRRLGDRKDGGLVIAGYTFTIGMILRWAIELGVFGAIAVVESKANKQLDPAQKKKIIAEAIKEFKKQQAQGKLKGKKLKL